ncbi:MAG: hypothetical protein ABSD30_01545 [Candidatus Binatus sp.]
MNSEIVEFDLKDPRNRRVASEIVDLMLFYKTGAGRPRDIVSKMRFVVETYCTFTYPGFFDSDDTLSSIVEKIRNTGERHPACALLDELDDIHNYSWDHCRDDAPNRDVADPLDVKELTGYVRRTLMIVKAISNLQ